MADNPTRPRKSYLAYLLRLWQESADATPGDDPPLWRASLESSRSDQRLGFASLVDLVAFLEKETGSTAQDGEGLAEGSSQSPAIQE